MPDAAGPLALLLAGFEQTDESTGSMALTFNQAVTFPVNALGGDMAFWWFNPISMQAERWNGVGFPFSHPSPNVLVYGFEQFAEEHAGDTLDFFATSGPFTAVGGSTLDAFEDFPVQIL